MTITQGLFRLVLGGPDLDSEAAIEPALEPAPGSALEPAPEGSDQAILADFRPAAAESELDEEALSPGELGLSDLEAAVALVQSGAASRVVLAEFPSWPGLLWRAYELAEQADVLILPTVVRAGGRVDIVVARAVAPEASR